VVAADRALRLEDLKAGEQGGGGGELGDLPDFVQLALNDQGDPELPKYG